MPETPDLREALQGAEILQTSSVSVTPENLVAAKQMLGWSSVRLASRLGTTYGTLQKFLLGGKIARPFYAHEVCAALKSYGIEIFSDENGVGVRLTKARE